MNNPTILAIFLVKSLMFWLKIDVLASKLQDLENLEQFIYVDLSLLN